MKFTMSPSKLACFAFFLLALSMSACKTISIVQFQALEAPRVVLPPDVSRIAFVDRNIHFPADTIVHYFTYNNLPCKDSIDNTQEMTLNCYQGFVENISEYLQQDSIPFVNLPSKMMPDTIRHYSPMDWSEVSHICRETESDVLVVLENIQVYTKYDFMDGSIGGLSTDIHYLGFWRIYDPLYEKIYDERFLVDSLFIDVPNRNSADVMTRKQVLNDASYELGKSYVDLISPRWVDVSRKYFVSGDKRLSAALYFMNKNEFDSAIDIWKSLISENDLKLAGRAAYNLAVVYEMKGDLKNARGWIRKAMYFYKTMKNIPDEYKEIEAYALVLNSRWINGKKIKRFFGEEE